VDFRYEDFYAGITKGSYSIHLKIGRPANEGGNDRDDNDNLSIIFSVDGIENLYEELSSKSVTFTQPLRDMPYGKEFYVADPDGHIIAFLEEP